jgi:hypothetical protein
MRTDEVIQIGPDLCRGAQLDLDSHPNEAFDMTRSKPVITKEDLPISVQDPRAVAADADSAARDKIPSTQTTSAIADTKDQKSDRDAWPTFSRSLDPNADFRGKRFRKANQKGTKSPV